MPVKLKSLSDPQDAMSISLSDYTMGRDNFVSHYYLDSCNSSFGGQDLEIPWDDLATAVNSYLTNTGASDVALRMVYCFDETETALYLRVEICAMAELEMVPGTYDLVTKDDAWYKIDKDGMSTTSDTDLTNEAYLFNLYYCDTPPCDGTNCQNLIDEKSYYARTITFPWFQEILQMYIDNGSPADASICFGATSYVHANSGESDVPYPHGIVMYLKNSDGDAMLNNDYDTICVFSNKGIDYGTLCPKNCGVYVLPA